MDELTKLKIQVETLQKKIEALSDVSKLPVEIERVFRSRLNFLSSTSKNLGAFEEANLRRTIALSGNAQNIEVLEYPVNYIPVTFQGSPYKIPVFDN